MDTSTTKNEKTELKTLNRWLIFLMVIAIIWTAGVLLYVDNRTAPTNHPLPIIMVDSVTGKIVDPAYTNLFITQAIGLPVQNKNISNFIEKTNNVTKPMFEQKASYEIKELVVVNYFYVEAIVVTKVGTSSYTVMYKDHNHVLQLVTLPKELLLSPTSQYSVSPVSLLVD